MSPALPLIALGQVLSPKDLDGVLSRSDALACLEIIYQSLSCRDPRVLAELLAAIGRQFGAEHCACLLSSLGPLDPATRLRFVDGSYPRPWLALYRESGFQRIDPIVAENFSSFRIQSWADTYTRRPPPRSFLGPKEDFGLKAGLSWGARAGKGGSLFSFSGARMPLDRHSRVMLDLVLPHLHRALVDLDPAPAAPAPLSAREREVLRWISAGKSSWEVGTIMEISERTVNYHIRNIIRKLDAVNRPQAVALALRLGLLEL